MYEGAFAENFHWPQPKPDSEEDSSEEGKFFVFLEDVVLTYKVK